jgi:formylglycine-generating enzyme required for sulfatase activity
LARTQVTRRQYQAFLDDSGYDTAEFWHQPEFCHPQMPAVGVSWNDATAYCQWYVEAQESAVRLPTEAEWEYAAKANRDVIYPWGNEPPESLPNYARRWLDGPEAVDAYPSLHPWGFLGLGENVHEWCSDWYDAGYYKESPAEDPCGPDTGRRRSSRGGAWRHKVRVSRCAARSSIPPDRRYSDYGFRLAADVIFER